MRNLTSGYTIVQLSSVSRRDREFVAEFKITEKSEMRIAVTGEDRVSGSARKRTFAGMGRTEGQRPAAGTGKNDLIDAEPLDREPGDRPGVGMGPGFDRPTLRVVEGLGPSMVQQDLRQHGLRLDVTRLTEQDEATDKEGGD
jgi:hypothetical protein